jgi:hypothetical protein
MTMTVAELRSTPELLEFIAGGGQPKYLFFWGHQPQPDGRVGKGCFSQWWRAGPRRGVSPRPGLGHRHECQQ